MLKNLYARSYFDTEKYLPCVSRLYHIFMFAYIQAPNKIYAKTKKNSIPEEPASKKAIRQCLISALLFYILGKSLCEQSNTKYQENIIVFHIFIPLITTSKFLSRFWSQPVISSKRPNLLLCSRTPLVISVPCVLCSHWPSSQTVPCDSTVPRDSWTWWQQFRPCRRPKNK